MRTVTKMTKKLLIVFWTLPSQIILAAYSLFTTVISLCFLAEVWKQMADALGSLRPRHHEAADCKSPQSAQVLMKKGYESSVNWSKLFFVVSVS